MFLEIRNIYLKSETKKKHDYLRSRTIFTNLKVALLFGSFLTQTYLPKSANWKFLNISISISMYTGFVSSCRRTFFLSTRDRVPSGFSLYQFKYDSLIPRAPAALHVIFLSPPNSIAIVSLSNFGNISGSIGTISR